jgi:dipeptidyl-peptidase-4
MSGVRGPRTLMLLASSVLAVGGVSSADAQIMRPDTLTSISIDRFYSWPSLIGTEPRGVAWSSDSRTMAFLWNDSGQPFLDVWTADAATGALTRVTALPSPTVSTNPPGFANAMPAAYADQRAAIAAEMDGGIGRVQWHPDGTRLLIARNGQLYLVRRDARAVTALPTPLATGGSVPRAEFSPDGTQLAFMRGGNIHVALLAGDSLSRVRQLTSVARDGVGVESFAWSPDGRALAFVETDRTAIPLRDIPDYLPDDAVMSRVRRAYPGEPSEMRRLAVVNVRDALDPVVRWMPLGDERSDLIFTYSWHPTAHVLVVDKSDVLVKDRRLLTVDATSGAVTVLVREQEPTNVSAEWRAAWAPDGKGVYFLSDRDRDYHVWYVRTPDPRAPLPTAPRAVTSGDWAVFGMQVTPRGLLVTANAARPEERTLYLVPLDGGAMRRVSVRPGTHTGLASPDGQHAAVLFSADTVPPDLYVTDLTAPRAVTGRGTRVSTSGASTERRVTISPSAAFAAYTWPTPRYVTFPSRTDGVTLHGRLILPPNYVPGQRLPVVVGSIYSNTVRNQWGGRNAHPLWGFDRVLLDRGYALFAVDVAGSAGHGTAFRRRILLDYGGIDVEDIHSGVEWLLREGIADSTRMAIWGSSYGGLLTSMSLFKKPGLFTAGIAAAPATNVWHALTGEQRVMARPQEQMQAYANASSHTQAAGARDALMFVHGMRDNIVLYRDSIWLLQYLMQLGQTVEFVTLPDAPHGWDLGPHYQTRFAFQRMLEFLDRHLSVPER